MEREAKYGWKRPKYPERMSEGTGTLQRAALSKRGEKSKKEKRGGKNEPAERMSLGRGWTLQAGKRHISEKAVRDPGKWVGMPSYPFPIPAGSVFVLLYYVYILPRLGRCQGVPGVLHSTDEEEDLRPRVRKVVNCSSPSVLRARGVCLRLWEAAGTRYVRIMSPCQMLRALRERLVQTRIFLSSGLMAPGQTLFWISRSRAWCTYASICRVCTQSPALPLDFLLLLLAMYL